MGHRLGTIDMGRKLGAVPPFCGGELGPHLPQCGWAEAYLRTKWYLDSCSRLATIDMGQKLGALPHFGQEGAGSPSNTMSLGSRPTSIPIGVFIYAVHATVWPQ